MKLLSAVFAVAGALALAVLAVVTVVGVFWRYVLRDPIFGIEDIATMALTVAVAGAIAWGATRGSHVSVNVIPWFGGRKLTRITDVLARAISTGVLLMASVALFKKGSCGSACGAMTSNLSILHEPFFYALGGAMALFSATMLLHLLIGLAHWSGDDPHEVAD
ncbi:MAG: TRAP transporter small permease subunit [Rhodobacteraceae bacterium]|nr:TRAP transporter small permease subunit [Paracoccaceae bacterium]